MMQAAWYRQTGGTEVLNVSELPKPEPAQGQVLVRLIAHGVNPTDCKRRAGLRGERSHQLKIPGYDGAGIIEAVGDHVDPARTGEAVWVWEGFHNQWFGTAAEFICVDQSRAMPLPASSSFAHGACLGVPALTACHALMLAGPLADESVIVTGAAGVVCNYAVQMAKIMGARVLAVVRGESAKQDDAIQAGADQVINTDRDSLLEAALDFTKGRGARCLIDVDLGAHLAIASRITAVNGTISSFGTASNPKPTLDWTPMMQRNIRLCGIGIFSVPELRKIEALRFVQTCLERDALWHRIDSRWPLTAMALAHERQEQGRPRGKVIVTISEETFKQP